MYYVFHVLLGLMIHYTAHRINSVVAEKPGLTSGVSGRDRGCRYRVTSGNQQRLYWSVAIVPGTAQQCIDGLW